MSTCVLKDLIEISKDGEWGKGESFDDSVEMLAIRGTDFEDARFAILDSIPRRHVIKRIAERKALRPWDVLIEAAGGTKGQITGRTVLLRPQVFERSDLPITCASFSRFIRFRKDVCDPEFMFWYLQYLYGAGFMHAYHTQHTGVSRFQWTTFSEREPLTLPSLAVQRRIAPKLSVYDELIAINQQRIRILEELARALHREWFIDFRFPGHGKANPLMSPNGHVPQGWEVLSFDELLVSMTGGDWGSDVPTKEEVAEVGIVRGTDFNEVAYGAELRVPVRYIKASSLKSRILQVGDIIIENSVNAKSRCIGTPLLIDDHVLRRLGRDSVAASFCKVFRFREPDLGSLAYLHLRHLRENKQMERYQNVATNGIGNFQSKKFVQEEHLILPIDVALRGKLLQPIASLLHGVSVLASQIANLRRTRDLLLPRLLAGQLNLDTSTDRPQ